MELASQQSPLTEQFYQASHSKMQAVWHEFFALAQQYQFIQPDLPERQTGLILSLLTGDRHHQVLLGLRPIPDLEERGQIIRQAIELFMLKYGLQTGSR
jgi:TetR/AcrR family transcriptional repressor of mexJK operon